MTDDKIYEQRERVIKILRKREKMRKNNNDDDDGEKTKIIRPKKLKYVKR